MIIICKSRVKIKVYRKLLKSYTVHKLQMLYLTKIKSNFIFVHNFTYYILINAPTITCKIGKCDVYHRILFSYRIAITEDLGITVTMIIYILYWHVLPLSLYHGTISVALLHIFVKEKRTFYLFLYFF